MVSSTRTHTGISNLTRIVRYDNDYPNNIVGYVLNKRVKIRIDWFSYIFLTRTSGKTEQTQLD